MPIRIGLLLYSLLPLGLILAKRGPVTAFHKAGAISPETARKPVAVQAGGDLSHAVKKGLLIAVGDGRYYVNTSLLRRHQRRMRVVIVASCMALAAILLWLRPPWD